MLRKKRRISESIDDDPMAGLTNLSDAMLVLALGFLIFAIMALSANPELISNSPNTNPSSSLWSYPTKTTERLILSCELLSVPQSIMPLAYQFKG